MGPGGSTGSVEAAEREPAEATDSAIDASRDQPFRDATVRDIKIASNFRAVATLTIPAQVFDTAERREFGDNLSFDPWRTLPEHRPLGGIGRARRQVYEALSIFRHERNQAPRVEPSVND